MSGTKRKKAHKNIIIKAYIGILLLVFALVVFVNALRFNMMSILILHGMALVFLFLASGMMLGPFYRIWRRKNGTRIQKTKAAIKNKV